MKEHTPRIEVLGNVGAVAERAAALVIARLQDRRPITLGLATGATMTPLYCRLVAATRAGLISFRTVSSFNLDEYVGVAPQSPGSFHANMQQHLGLPVEVLTPQIVQERWPYLSSDLLIGATWCPTDGFLLPHMIYTEGFRRAKELGVQVQPHTEVLGAVLRADRISALVTDKGTVEADWFVNATNAWAARLSPRIGGMALPVSPLKRYLYFLKPSQPVMDATAWQQLPMIIYGMGNHRGAHSRPEHDLLLLAWAHETEPETHFSDIDQDRIDPSFRHDNGIDNYGCAILSQIEQFSPLLANAGGLIATTSGFYAVTPDANPLIGHDSYQQNLIHAVGFSGHGLMHAPITAFLVEAILAGDVEHGHVRLPGPFDHATIDLGRFEPGRTFESSYSETLIL